jgi:phage terminase Nu1 subunit (DNA packaging protein)
MALFTLRQICAILAGDGNDPLSEMRITQLVRKGMPKEARGQYDPVRCMYWYIGWLRGTMSKRETGNDDGSSTNLTFERKRLLAVQAQRAELELAKSKGSMISIVDHARALSEVVVESRARLLAVPSRVARQLVNETSLVMAQAKVEKEIRAALAELAKHVPRFEAPESVITAAPPAAARLKARRRSRKK